MTTQITHADGIYLNLPEADYHADPALSASGIKNLLQSPADYWFNSVHNPDREDDDTAALSKGKLYHSMFFEPELFERTYAVKPGGMAFSTKDGKAWRAKHQHKQIVKHEDVHEIAHNRILAEKRGLFEFIGAGHSEVSIFWTNGTGNRCKCRVDWLSPTAAFDLKTFSNPTRKDLDMCLAHTIFYERYHIAAVWYLMLIEEAKKLKTFRSIEDGSFQPYPGFELSSHPHKFWLIFQQTGNTPNLALREIEHRDTDLAVNQYWRAAERAINQATSTYAQFMKSHGPDQPWISPLQPKAIADHEFSPWMIEE